MRLTGDKNPRTTPTSPAASVHELTWPSSKRVWLVSRRISVRFDFGSAISSEVVVCGHCLCDFAPHS